MAENMLVVEPAISRQKFDHEVNEYRKIASEQLKRGWWLLDVSYPQIFVVFASARLQPPAVIFGAIIDFSNYDFWPPSVTLVNPFTREPYVAKRLPVLMKRRIEQAPPAFLAMQPGAENLKVESEQPLLQFHSPDDVPFLCVPGIREYHDHPAHSGDSWLLYRGTGIGTLYFVLDVLYKYGVQPIDQYAIQMVPQIRFGQSQVPE